MATDNPGWGYPRLIGAMSKLGRKVPAVLSAARAESWGATDLFPEFGMPSFRRPSGCLLAPFRVLQKLRRVVRPRGPATSCALDAQPAETGAQAREMAA